MPVVKLTLLARQDVDRILYDLRVCSVQAADAVSDAIDQTFSMLAKHPGAGQERPEFAAGLRSLPARKYRNYLVFYRRISDGVEIIRVVHGARDLENLFRR